MNEKEVHLKLSEIKIDNDNLDYIKLTGEICGKLRWDLVKLFAIPDVSRSGGFEQELQNDYGASDYDMMMIFGTSASEQAQYLKDNPQFNGIVEPMGEYVESRLRRRW